MKQYSSAFSERAISYEHTSFLASLMRTSTATTSTKSSEQMAVPSPTIPTSSSQASISFRELKVRGRYEISDRRGQWFECEITDVRSDKFSIHYLGLPTDFNETLHPGDTNKLRHIENSWRSALEVGDFVDVYFDTIGRYENLPIVDISTSSKPTRIKVGTKETDFIEISSEQLAKSGSRYGREKRCPFPHGAGHALEVAGKIEAKRVAWQIYEELASRRQLPHSKCVELFENIEVFFGNERSLHHCRYRDAKAALMLEAAVEMEDEEALTPRSLAVIGITVQSTAASSDTRSFNLKSVTFENITAPTVEREDHQTHNIEVLDSTFDSRLPALAATLAYNERFRVVLSEDWHRLDSVTRGSLELVDILETKAMKLSYHPRVMLFAEAAMIIGSLAERQRGPIFGVCMWRLARHYVNGYGVDISDLSTRDAADIQASGIYKAGHTQHFYSLGQLGVLASCGRSGAFSGGEDAENGKLTPKFIIEKLVLPAVSQGAHWASSWLARMYLEGWGDQLSGTSRFNIVKEAHRLYEQCVAFGFNADQLQPECDKAESLVAAATAGYSGSQESYFLLACHVFSDLIKEQIVQDFPTVLCKTIWSYSRQHVSNGKLLPAPRSEVLDRTKSSQDELKLLKELQDRILFNSNFQVASEDGTDGKGTVKGSLSAQKRETLKLWINQNFNRVFIPAAEQDLATTRKWSRELADGLIDDLLDARAAAELVCKPLQRWEVKPSKQVFSRMVVAELPCTEAVVEATWTKALSEAKVAYETLNPKDRLLRNQVSFFDAGSGFLKSPQYTSIALQACGHEAGADTSPADVFFVCKQARYLAFLARDQDVDDMDKSSWQHHFKSAASVILEARKTQAPREAHKHVTSTEFDLTMTSLNAKCRHHFTAASGEFPTRIGYHNIIDTLRVHAFLEQKGATDWSGNSKLRFLSDPKNSQINSGWRKGADRSLIAIFEEFRHLTEQIQEEQAARAKWLYAGGACACADLVALTYKDPWSDLMQLDLDEEISQYLSRVPEALVAVAGTDVSELDVVDGILTEQIAEKFKILKIPDSTGIFRRLSTSTTQVSAIQVKKKMLFVLDNLPGLDWRSSSSNDPGHVAILASSLIAGMEGRCIDGISSFCENFIQDVLVLRAQRAHFGDIPETMSKLIIAVSRMVYTMKVEFMKRHVSRHKDEHEGRTAGGITLQFMLMLPLGLQGSYGEVRYPGFAHRRHADTKQMDSKNVTERYLRGGRITFDEDEGSEEFSPLSLYHVATRLRSIIVKSEHGLDSSSTAASEPANPQYLPRYRDTHSVDEEIIEAFCESDIVIGPYFHEAKAAQWTHANIFFRPLERGDDLEDEDVSQRTKPTIVQVMKDAVLVRILEVCQYAHVPEKFWTAISKTWILRN